ncbi:MAG: shikimate kinase [Bryobacteraceae bacterium]
MNPRLKQTPGIYLLGFMGSGKSTVGRHLARRLGWSFFDLDEEIEAAEKTTIAQIFATRGEAEFRRIESEMLAQHVRAIERGHPAVVALGGGAFLAASNRDLASDHGVTVWLDCDFDRIARRVAQADHRPLARDPAKLAALFDERRDIYRLADVHIPVETDDPEAVAEVILAHPFFR